MYIGQSGRRFKNKTFISTFSGGLRLTPLEDTPNLFKKNAKRTTGNQERTRVGQNREK